MNAELLNTFFSEDGDVHARQKLLEAIHKQGVSGAPMVQELIFNRFKITLDFEGKQVSLQDDLTVGPPGEFKLNMDEFKKALQEHK
jgi:hypothetical protein